MKKKNIINSAAILCIALGFIACTNDEPIVDSDSVPMSLTATVAPQTRSTVDNVWDGETVAINTTQAGASVTTVKKYIVNSDGTLSLSSDEKYPFYFQSSSETKSVTAWYPYSDTYSTALTVETDQSGDGYAKSDLLKADAISATASGTNTLIFKHLTAKLTLNVTNKTQSDLTVEVYGGITPHKTTNDDNTITYNAMIVPKQLSSGMCLFSFTIDDKIYIYDIPSELTLEASHEYIYNVKTSLDGLEVTSVSDNAGWTEGETTQVVSKKSIESAEVGDYYTKDGSYLYDKGLSAELLALVKDEIIGVVFCTDASRIGDAEKSALTEKGVTTPHGLVLAKSNVTQKTNWGTNSTDTSLSNISQPYSDISGLANCNVIWTNWDSENSSPTYSKAVYQAFNSAWEYRTGENTKAPEKTTGWFLPSSGQWVDVLQNIGDCTFSDTSNKELSLSGASFYSNFNTIMNNIGGDDLTTANGFWSSTEAYDGGRGHSTDAFRVLASQVGSLNIKLYWKDYDRAVRCVLAF